MILNNKRLLKYIVRFGKTKSKILFFLFLTGCFGLFSIIYGLFYKMFSNKSFSYIYHENAHFLLLYLVIAAYASWTFYDEALKKLKEYESLKKRGLTEDDIERIAFVKEWAEIRKVGKYRYCLFNKGIISGMIIFMPIPLLLILVGGILKSFYELYYTIAFLFIGLIIGYSFGVLIYLMRWRLNEREFIRLTDPIR